MDVNQQISLYSTGFYVSLVITIASFALSAFFFFRFRIPSVMGALSGRKREKEVRRMRKSGVMRSSKKASGNKEKEAQREKRSGGEGPAVIAAPSPQEAAAPAPVKAGAVQKSVEPAPIRETAMSDPDPDGTGKTVRLDRIRPKLNMPAGTPSVEIEKPEDYGFVFETVEHLVVVHTSEYV